MKEFNKLLKLPGRKIGYNFCFDNPLPAMYVDDKNKTIKKPCVIVALSCEPAERVLLLKFPGWKEGHTGIEEISDGTYSYWWVFPHQVNLVERK